MSTNHHIQLDHISKRFGQFMAVDDISLEFPSGQLTALLGPSGSGKTTVLRLIAGLEKPDSGSILFSGSDIRDRKLQERRVGFVFQHYALFRHMTVFENVAFGLKIRPKATRPSPSDIAKKVKELLQLVQLDRMEDRYPSQLSGGQKQRIALARALAIEPEVLLLDEPFGALDAKVRKELRQWLRKLHDELHITSIFVTHDVDEALEVSDQIVVMNQGKVEQTGTPEQIYQNPANAFVYQFIGDVNLFHCRVEDGNVMFGSAKLKTSSPAENQSSVAMYVRPHQLDIHHTPTGDQSFPAVIKQINFAGLSVRVELESEWGTEIVVSLSRQRAADLQLQVGKTVFVSSTTDTVFFEDYTI